MKKLVVALALLASLATPVFAQSFNPEFGGANVLAGPTQTQQDEGWNAMAQAPRSVRQERRQATRAPEANVQYPLIPQAQGY